jgi:hypothetical protein
MRKVVYFTVIAALLALDWSAGAAVSSQKKSASRKSSVTRKKSAAHRTSSRSHASTRSRGTSHSRTASRSRNSRTTHHTAKTWRNRQTTPTPERYKEIQEALVAKGYLKADDATGSWGQSSVEALKRFQMEQNIESTGKINSLSLIALGLGPKHEPAPPPVPIAASPIPDGGTDR